MSDQNPPENPSSDSHLSDAEWVMFFNALMIELNNPLVAIQVNAELHLIESTHLDDDLRKDLEQIVRGCRHMHNVLSSARDRLASYKY